MKKKLYKALSIICIMTLLIGLMQSFVWATNSELQSSDSINNNEKHIALLKDYGEMFLDLHGYSKQLEKPIVLYNTDIQVEALCFNITEGGYIIININDLSVPEYSVVAKNPFEKYKNNICIYNGPLSYYKQEGNEFIYLNTNEAINKSEVRKIYSCKKINIDEKIKNTKDLIENKEYLLDSYVTERIDNYNSLPTWSSSYYCGIDAAAIVLAYYDDEVDDGFVPGLIDSCPDLQEYLDENDYIHNGGTSAFSLCYGDILIHSGLNGYLNYMSLDLWDAQYEDYTMNNLTPLIGLLDYPVITGTEAGHPISDNHWIITYGFQITPFSSYLIVNDGFGNDEIFTTTNEAYYNDIVWIG